MDKLEKALEKSRQARATSMPSGMGFDRGPFASVEKAPAYTAPTHEPQPIDEAQMERHRIIAHHTRSTEADVYRQLRTKVLQIMAAGNYKSLAITSPRYGDGKTTVAINLAVSIALDQKQTVLLVDLDLRKPSLHEYLGMQPQAGLTDYLLHDVPLHECLLRPPFERVNTLPAGSSLDNSSELLGSPKMIRLAQELKNRYPDRMIIYDMPPALSQDDPIAFLPQTDAVLVIVRDGVTRTDDLKRCLQMLSGANVIGTVLNDCW